MLVKLQARLRYNRICRQQAEIEPHQALMVVLGPTQDASHLKADRGTVSNARVFSVNPAVLEGVQGQSARCR
jgi:hypothetical protein